MENPQEAHTLECVRCPPYEEDYEICILKGKLGKLKGVGETRSQKN
jgi:hypothetical protein